MREGHCQLRRPPQVGVPGLRGLDHVLQAPRSARCRQHWSPVDQKPDMPNLEPGNTTVCKERSRDFLLKIRSGEREAGRVLSGTYQCRAGSVASRLPGEGRCSILSEAHTEASGGL